jgi:hypothetical protein
MNEDDNKPVRLAVNNSNEISDLSTLEISVQANSPSHLP